MLKIKRDIPLKELSRFGLKYDSQSGLYILVNDSRIREQVIYIDRETRYIMFENPYIEMFDLLFDLINAGLVEKDGGEK